MKSPLKSIQIITATFILTACGAEDEGQSNLWVGSWTGLNPSATPRSGQFELSGDTLSRLYWDNLLLEESVQISESNDHTPPFPSDERLFELVVFEDGDHALMARSLPKNGAGADVGIFQRDNLPQSLSINSINGSWTGEWAYRSFSDSIERGWVTLGCVDLQCQLVMAGEDPIELAFSTRTSFAGLWIAYGSPLTGPFMNIAASPDGKALAGSFCYKPYPDEGKDIFDICHVMGFMNR